MVKVLLQDRRVDPCMSIRTDLDPSSKTTLFNLLLTQDKEVLDTLSEEFCQNTSDVVFVEDNILNTQLVDSDFEGPNYVSLRYTNGNDQFSHRIRRYKSKTDPLLQSSNVCGQKFHFLG